MLKISRTVIKNVEKRVKEILSGESTGHDWYHIDQVRTMALRIAEKEGGNKQIIEIAALAHDVGDKKFHATKEIGQKATRKVLKDAGVSEDTLKKIEDIIDNVSFSGGKIPESREGKIVQDADRLYALGAIGIARAFAYGASRNRLIHDPEIKGALTTINHFYEKLLLLKDKMNTKTGRTIAKSRHDYMEKFLKQFYAEWNATD
jgi:uncharacterized protein